jgi:diguanylate cyclase (GGDEF)-like protein
MDVDNFKYFNDTYGHAAGDRALALTARALREAVRGADIVGRFGGDEFVAILPDTDLSGAGPALERIEASMNGHPLALDGVTLRLRLSCGVAVYPLHGRHPDDLLRVADAGMYRAKRGGDVPSALLNIPAVG